MAWLLQDTFLDDKDIFLHVRRDSFYKYMLILLHTELRWSPGSVQSMSLIHDLCDSDRPTKYPCMYKTYDVSDNTKLRQHFKEVAQLTAPCFLLATTSGCYIKHRQYLYQRENYYKYAVPKNPACLVDAEDLHNWVESSLAAYEERLLLEKTTLEETVNSK